MSGRWNVRPQGSNWGAFGGDDQLGRINLLTAERVRLARDEIVTGEAFSLSLPLNYPGGRVLSPMREPPRLSATVHNGDVVYNLSQPNAPEWTDVQCDDHLAMSLQYSTHWDGLAHVGQVFDVNGDGRAEPVYYNGFRAGTDVVAPDGEPGLGKGAKRLGIETIARAPLVGRGVLVDLHARFGGTNEPVSVSAAMLQDAMAGSDVTLAEGDILVLHTGFSDLILAMGGRPDPQRTAQQTIALDGRDAALLEFVERSGVAAIAADNFAVETYPAGTPASTPCSQLPLHELCLFKLGIPLGELWNLGPIARALQDAGRNRFFLSAPPLDLPGAVASPLTPIGII